LNLAYDLRYATDHFPGIGSHARALAGALLEQPGIASLTFLWDPRARNSRFDLEPLRRHPRARWHEVDVPALAVSTARGTGRVLTRLGADAYLSPFWLRPEGTEIPCVLTLHDVLPLARPEMSSWPRRWAYARAMDRAAEAAAVVTSSRFSRDEILRLTRIRPERLHVVPLGVEPPASALQRPERPPAGPFALVVGANRVHKGLDTLADAWRALGPRAPLSLVSAGADLRGAFPLAVMAREIPDLHVLGAVTPAELEWLYRHATLVLVPSRYEGFGFPLLEAAARGAPVLASDLPSLRETGEGLARFVAGGQGEAWARAIRQLLADEPELARMRVAGPPRAAAYGCAVCAAGIERVLREALMGLAA
jgi:alpha-1,3-rhamnosyl/mannosyltransferase